jgi:hypothetical protein
MAAAAPLIAGLAGVSAQPAHAEKIYVAKLTPLNSRVSGREPRGDLRVAVAGDTLVIALDAQGLPGGMMHMAHLHGHPGGENSTCPAAAADTNRDGIVDLAETEPAAGVTMIPLDDFPDDLDIAGDTYPVASFDGHLTYEQDASFAALARHMAGAFDGASPDLAKRVVFIHGVAAATALPDTVASLPGEPAQATHTIACGKLVREK